MKTDRELWVAYCRKRWKSKPLIDDENTIECLKVAYKIGCADGFDSGVTHGYNIGFKEGKKKNEWTMKSCRHDRKHLYSGGFLGKGVVMWCPDCGALRLHSGSEYSKGFEKRWLKRGDVNG